MNFEGESEGNRVYEGKGGGGRGLGGDKLLGDM